MIPTYRLDCPAAEIGRLLGADPGDDPWQGGAVVPGGYAPVIVADAAAGPGGRRLVPRQWGVPPPPRGASLVPFLRNPDSPFWIGTLRHTQFRCLVPISRVRRGKEWFSPSDEPVTACAGVWRDSEIPSFAIVTAGAAGGGRGVGLPVIVPPAAFALWLHAEFRVARQLIDG